jgi:hypothetical protein
LRHPAHPILTATPPPAIAVPTGRGWRIDKVAHDAQVDAVIALMAALEGAKRQPSETRLVAKRDSLGAGLRGRYL